MRLIIVLAILFLLSITKAKTNEKPLCETCVCSPGTVDCYNKTLKNIPKIISSNTTILNVSHNLITEIPNGIFHSVPSLKILDISFNNIFKLHKDSFTGLSQLKSLFIQNNQLSLNESFYPTGVFQPLKNLQTLNISNNVYGYHPSDTYPEQALGHLSNLSDLTIDGIQTIKLGSEFSNLTKLETLTFAGSCKTQEIHNDSLIHVSYLRRLTLSRCYLNRLDSHAFSGLKQLEYLDISHNIRLGLETASIALQNLRCNLKYLNVAALVQSFEVGVKLKTSQVQRIRHLPITHLFLDSNRIELVEVEVMSYLPPNITMISFCDNKPTWGPYMLATYGLKHLTILNASKQFQSHIPTKAWKYPLPVKAKRSMLQPMMNERTEMKQVYGEPARKKTRNAIPQEFSKEVTLPKIRLPPMVQYLNISDSGLKYTIPQINFDKNVVRTLDLSANELHKWYGPITGADHLEWLDLSINLCDFISKNFLRNASSVLTLNISSNYLATSIHADEDGEIFQSLINLKILRISDNKLRSLPHKLFKNLVHLEELDLSRNIISSFTLKTDHMTHLKMVDLSNNVLTTLPKSFRQFCDDQHKHNNTVSIDLREQTLSCTCDNLEFLEWMDSNTTHFIDRHHYTCVDANSKEISMENLIDIIDNLKIKCASHTVLVVVLTVSLAFIITLVVGSFVYKYRWKLRYVYYLTRSKFRGYSAIGGAAQNRFDFDAFVSYADEDRRVVVTDMINKLEQEQGIQLCIHHRDFLIGEEIAANILNAVRNSKKTLIILSSNFLASYWCNYELNMAHMESIETGRNVIILVVYEHVPMKDIPDILQNFMKTNSYIEYTEDPQGNILFWDQLLTAINSV